MNIMPEQLEMITEQFKTLKDRSPFYAKKFDGIDLAAIKTQEEFETLPFTDKGDLREAYPLGLTAVPMEKIVRIHSSSGTTGTPVIVPYTKKDVEDWAVQFARCYEYAGVTPADRVQITPGYGLWTAGIGFQAGAELLGAMAVPMGPGNTEKQIQFMMDMETTVLTATASYALLLAEEIEKRGIQDKIKLKKLITGSERAGEKIRNRIIEALGVEYYDIYGLTEVYGPGIGISCQHSHGMHVWSDYVYLEIIDPDTGKVLPDGEWGEIVLTTLQKEGAPLIRFRTHDLSRIIPGECACGHNEHPRIDTITGRSDDMMKIHGVNVFPAQIEEILATFPELSSEYQIRLSHLDGRDTMRIYVETNGSVDWEDLRKRVASSVKAKIGFTPLVKIVELGLLPRSEKKTKRVFDERYD
ncbi:Phenylacetate-coenzyme A ligase [Slackia heliotrinireducens]|uniref:Phenylacetate-coenzyme A ligase n=1 Tax=Slackia heliotrinireducens (strain ATCC 29202 / DSM 20476 / NCTC 11029 / RHS 1) TaxID=471855 RepID=C7N410_SLAHD|nr:phenylacetate--CoA ligase [Slackia heliotrinireducens]ACV23746.1 phenylacetate-CoA ligase [Slackia heliotrinireducens DSM 20476]VEH03359.1 Phenylacetate-coenzyme A ligase [Slackia heliotrinireducens]